MTTLGVLGGSGVYEMVGLHIEREESIETPFGIPSAPVVHAWLEHPENPAGSSRTKLLFLARHGRRHEIPPHQINYRANICAMKMLGADQMISISAVGSMREHIAPGDVVVVDQYIDWTKARASTYFEDGVVAHVSLADPVCAQLHRAACLAAREARQESGRTFTIHETGAYICIEGPQFSTRAESRIYRSWGVDVIGMTAATEAKLAREAELPYVTLAMSTDYDCWHAEEEDVSVESVLQVLRENARLSQAFITTLPRYLPDPTQSAARGALRHARISHGPHSTPTRERLAWLLGDLP